jgi:hypothetical protein
MRKSLHVLDNERGSVLLVSVLVLLLLTIIGIFATTTTDIELRISGNEKLAKIAFYEADGGTEFGRELLEQNIACPEGFPVVTSETYAIIPPGETHGVFVDNPIFYRNERDEDDPSLPGDANRDIHIPYESDVQVDDNSKPHTNLTVEGVTTLLPGSAIQMAAGYEGKGRGAAAGGTQMLFDIFSQRIGRANSRACVCIEYRHVVGDEDQCMYPGGGGILQ